MPAGLAGHLWEVVTYGKFSNSNLTDRVLVRWSLTRVVAQGDCNVCSLLLGL